MGSATRPWIVCALGALTACASGSGLERSPGQTTEGRVARGSSQEAIRVNNETTRMSGELPAPSGDVWNALVAVFDELELPVTTRVPQQGQLAAQEFRVRRIDGRRPSRYVDCGSTLTGPFADNAFVTLSVVSQVTTLTATSSELATEIQATARARASATGDLFCSTTGRLESLIYTKVLTQLPTGRD